MKCLKTTELFLEGKNRNYSLILELINTLYFGTNKTISPKEINDMVEKYGIPSEFNLSQSLMNENEPYNLYLLDKNPKGDYQLFINSSIPIQPYRIEKQWLKHILRNPKIKLFLENETIEKIKNLLANMDDIISQDTLVINRPCKQLEEVDDDLRHNFRLITKAIAEDKGIEYSYVTKNQILLENRKSIPFKLEYSMKEDWFYLISYSLDDNRPIKSLLSGFRDIKLIELKDKQKILKEDIEKSIEEKKVSQPIVIKIKNINNTLERALFQFSCFEREVDYDTTDKDLYYLSIFYYEFEKEEVLSRIFSLGRNAVVIEPEEIRAEIIERLMILKNKYHNNKGGE
ncbi:MAG: WYL domain-containing protein [Clostridiales bacterium]|nr:WYL domain-containing protein [Clostridiales bacterium]